MSNFSLFYVIRFKIPKQEKKKLFPPGNIKTNKRSVKQKGWSLQSVVGTQTFWFTIHSSNWYWLSPHDLLGFCSCLLWFCFVFFTTDGLHDTVAVSWLVSVSWHHLTWTPHSADLQAAGCWWGWGFRSLGHLLRSVAPTGWSTGAPRPTASRLRRLCLRCRRCSTGRLGGAALPRPFGFDWFLGWPAS